MKKIKSVMALTMAAMILTMGCAAKTDTGGATTAGTADKTEASAPADTGEKGDDVLVLKLGVPAPAGTVQPNTAELWADKLEAASGGKMTIEVLAGGVLGNTAAHYSQLEQGTLDFFLTGFDTATVLKEGSDFSVCVVPFLFEDLDHYHKFLDSDILKNMVEKVETANGIKYMGPISDQAPRSLTTTNTPVKVPADLKNMKIRTPESPAITKMLTAWGANPMVVSGGELFQALQTGMVDGQDNDLVNSYSSGFSEVQKYYMNLDYIYSDMVIWMSDISWNKLTPEQQGWLTQSLEETFKEASDTLWSTTYEECLKKFQEEGVTYIEVDREAFVKAAEEIAEKFDGDLFSAGLYDQIKGLK